METPLVRKLDQLLKLLVEGYVLNEPSMYSRRPRSELTLPMNLDVHYETPGMMWYVVEEIMKRLKEKNVPKLQDSMFNLLKVQLQEPECGVAWVIIHASNESALRWQVTAQGLYTEAMKNVVANLDADEGETEEVLPDENEKRRIAQYQTIASAMVDVYLEGEDGDADVDENDE